MSTDGLGWMVVTPQQLRNSVQDRPGEVYFLCCYDYFMHKPEHNFFLPFVPQEVLLQ